MAETKLTEAQIQDRNQLVATYIAVKREGDWYFFPYANYNPSTHTVINRHHKDDLCFHESWDWQAPVWRRLSDEDFSEFISKQYNNKRLCAELQNKMMVYSTEYKEAFFNNNKLLGLIILSNLIEWLLLIKSGKAEPQVGDYKATIAEQAAACNETYGKGYNPLGVDSCVRALQESTDTLISLVGAATPNASTYILPRLTLDKMRELRSVLVANQEALTKIKL